MTTRSPDHTDTLQILTCPEAYAKQLRRLMYDFSDAQCSAVRERQQEQSAVYDHDVCFAVSSTRWPSSKQTFQKRQGTRQVRLIEQASNADERSTLEAATTFRALVAHANDLAQGRVDLAYATKELCRECSAPTTDSTTRLKRVVRYLIQVPHLVSFPVAS